MCDCRPGEFECPTAVSLREISNHWYKLKHEVNYIQTRAMYIAHMEAADGSVSNTRRMSNATTNSRGRCG